MPIQVTFANPGVEFLNFPNICEEIQRMASEMGIRRDIHLEYGLSEVKSIDGPSAIATLLLPRDFSCISSRENPRDFWLRHELVHILYNDDVTNKYRRYTSDCTQILGLVIFCVSFYASYQVLNSSYCRIDSDFSPFVSGLVSLLTWKYYSIYLRGSEEKFTFKEKRADEEACRYMPVDEKIHAIMWLHKLHVESGAETSIFDPHLSNGKRIRLIWNSFTELERSQHPECAPVNLLKKSNASKSILERILT